MWRMHLGLLDVARGSSRHGNFAGIFKQFGPPWRRFIQK
jgi:hypothetical protein